MFTEIKDLFTQDHGSFSKNLQFNTLVVFIVVIIFFTYFFNNNYGFVIILISFAIYIANTYVSIHNDKSNDFNSVTMIKLQSLQSKVYDHIRNKIKMSQNNKEFSLKQSDIQDLYKKNELDSLYIDANLIHFLYSIIKLADYNPDIFFSLLKGTNNILRIKRDIDMFYESNKQYPENISELLETALLLRSNTINNLHDFIYTIPKISVMYKYLSDSVDRYSVLISRVTDSIYSSYQNNMKLQGINTNTRFISYNTTKPYESSKNHPVILHQENKTIPFYI
jgi:hypothetical protein